MKGLIALDIDGTVTTRQGTIHPSVTDMLSQLVKEGWILLFITGRPYPWAREVLQTFSVECYAAVQNGGLQIEWPSEKIVHREYLSRDVFEPLEQICRREQTDFAIYAGVEYEDLCFYRPAMFSPPILEYLKKRFQALGEKWVPCESFQEIPHSAFPSLKCFAAKEGAKRLEKQIIRELGLHAPAITDPFDEKYSVVQITHPHATKGATVKAFRKLLMKGTPVIAAGDDFNDEDMLREADVAIVMETADPSLHTLASIIAPPPQQLGIIEGIQKALTLLQRSQ